MVYSFEEDGTLTMSVRIQYQGDDEDFAWILPVVAPPELSIGSDALFDELLAATEPTFGVNSRTEGACRPRPQCVENGSCTGVGGGDFGCGAYSPGGGWTGDYIDPPGFSDAGTFDSGSRDSGAIDPGVTVYSEGTVGPYDTVVLGATTAAEVLSWLADHGYDIPATSEPLLETYAAQNHVFVALRLSANASTSLLAPLTMRMAVDEACLPIRLTAIATVDDMPIRAFFLGRQRVVPFNYSTAAVDTSDLNLYLGRGRSYGARVSEAVDALGGQAFVTDYAGRTPAIQLELESVLDLADSTSASDFLRALRSRGYSGDRRLLDIFQRYIVPRPRRRTRPGPTTTA